MSDQEIDQRLAQEAADIEERWARGQKASRRLHRNRPRAEPSLLYNVRMPASRLEQLRDLARREGLPPSTLMRQWVIERLDQELASDVAPDPRIQRAIRLELERAGLIKAS